VERLPPELLRRPTEPRIADGFSIERITQDRVAVIGEMNANLVRAPGLKSAANQSASV